MPPGHVGLIPRGIKFRVELPDGPARGYICENYGQHLRLPDLGPIGTFGLANARDFQAPVAASKIAKATSASIAKFGGGLWEAEIDHSPLDIVAWRGNYVPFKYDLYRFQCINTVTFDHPDPSIYCVLASPTSVPGTSNMEFGCFPPRWTVAEHTFRPPPFHRNVASEFLGLISGEVHRQGAMTSCPAARACTTACRAMAPMPRRTSAAATAELKPQYLDNTLVFLFETQLPIRPTKLRAGDGSARARLLRALAGTEEAVLADGGWMKRYVAVRLEPDRRAADVCDAASLAWPSRRAVAIARVSRASPSSISTRWSPRIRRSCRSRRNVKYTENGQRLRSATASGTPSPAEAPTSCTSPIRPPARSSRSSTMREAGNAA